MLKAEKSCMLKAEKNCEYKELTCTAILKLDINTVIFFLKSMQVSQFC